MDRPHVDASTYQYALDSVAKELIAQIERAWPKEKADQAKAGAPIVSTLQMAYRYWNAENFLAYGVENKIAGCHPEHSLVFPLIDRTLLEMLANVLFIVEEPKERAELFHKAGWRELKLEFDEIVRQYGTNPTPESKKFIDQQESSLEEGRKLFEITEEQAKEPSKMPSWPRIGGTHTYGASRVRPSTCYRRRVRYCAFCATDFMVSFRRLRIPTGELKLYSQHWLRECLRPQSSVLSYAKTCFLINVPGASFGLPLFCFASFVKPKCFWPMKGTW